MRKTKEQKGITLVALVITIIVLLILAGISIQALTNTGLFAQASQAKKETQRAQVTEWLNLKLIEVQMNNPTGTAEEIIEATRQNVVEHKNELEKIGNPVTVEDTKTEEDGEQVDIYFYVQVDEDVYKVDIKGAQFIGEAGKFPPIIKLESITGTTNTITVKIKTIRNEEGTLEIYIKSEDDTGYTLEKTATGEEATGIEYTFENLTQNKKYSIKIVATAKNEQVKEYTTDITLGSVPEGEGLIVFSPVTWSGGKASTTISSTETGYSIQYQVNNTSESGWTTGTSVTGLVHGDKVYARLWDGTNGGTASAAYNILDGTAPSASISLSATDTTTESSITATVTHSDSQSGVNIANCKWIYNTTSSAIGTDASSYTETFSSNPQTITLSTTTDGEYYLHVLTIDNAGNTNETISEKITIENRILWLYNEGDECEDVTGGWSWANSYNPSYTGTYGIGIKGSNYLYTKNTVTYDPGGGNYFPGFRTGKAIDISGYSKILINATINSSYTVGANTTLSNIMIVDNSTYPTGSTSWMLFNFAGLSNEEVNITIPIESPTTQQDTSKRVTYIDNYNFNKTIKHFFYVCSYSSQSEITLYKLALIK